MGGKCSAANSSQLLIVPVKTPKGAQKRRLKDLNARRESDEDKAGVKIQGKKKHLQESCWQEG